MSKSVYEEIRLQIHIFWKSCLTMYPCTSIYVLIWVFVVAQNMFIFSYYRE